MFDTVLETLRKADTKLIGSRRCFIVGEDSFHKLREFFREYETQTDIQVTREGYENFLVRMSSQDSQEYAICTKARPLLDDLWEDLNPTTVAAKPK